jgi:hypothetical protein
MGPAKKLVECSAVVVRVRSLGLRDRDGRELCAIEADIVVEQSRGRRIHIATHVPPGGNRLLRPGSVLPATLTPDDAYREVMIDWDTAISRLAPH